MILLHYPKLLKHNQSCTKTRVKWVQTEKEKKYNGAFVYRKKKGGKGLVVFYKLVEVLIDIYRNNSNRYHNYRDNYIKER